MSRLKAISEKSPRAVSYRESSPAGGGYYCKSSFGAWFAIASLFGPAFCGNCGKLRILLGTQDTTFALRIGTYIPWRYEMGLKRST